MTVGENIKKRRKALGMKQWELADILGLNTSSVSKIERGETEYISPAHIEKICQALHCTPSDLYGIQQFKFMSSEPLSDAHQELLTLIPLMTEDEVKALLEVMKAMFGYKRHASL